MTSFQRMVLIAAALFMITAYVADAARICECYKFKNCAGRGGPQIKVTTQSISDALDIAGLFRGLKFSFFKNICWNVFS